MGGIRHGLLSSIFIIPNVPITTGIDHLCVGDNCIGRHVLSWRSSYRPRCADTGLESYTGISNGSVVATTDFVCLGGIYRQAMEEHQTTVCYVYEMGCQKSHQMSILPEWVGVQPLKLGPYRKSPKTPLVKSSPVCIKKDSPVYHNGYSKILCKKRPKT